MYNTKNYTEQGGEVTHLGGHVVFEEECKIVGFPKVASLTPDSSIADIITALKASGYMSTEPNWVLVLENSKWDKGSGSFADENANLVFSDATDIEVQSSDNDCWTVTVNREGSESVQLTLVKNKSKGELIHPLNHLVLDVVLSENDGSYSMFLTDSEGSSVIFSKNDVDRHASYFDIDPETSAITLKNGVTPPSTLYIPKHVDGITVEKIARRGSEKGVYEGVENLYIPDGMAMDRRVFFETQSLKKIVFEGDVADIGSYTFYHCLNINYVQIKGHIINEPLDNVFEVEIRGHFEYRNRVLTTGELFNYLICYSVSDYSELFEIDSNGVLSEKNGASFPWFLLFPDRLNGITVTKISGCNSLSGLRSPYIIGDSVEIDSQAFEGAEFNEITIHCNTLSIGQYAFRNTANFDCLVFDANTLDIDSSAFASDLYFSAIIANGDRFDGLTWNEYLEGPDRFSDLFEIENDYYLVVQDGVTLPQDLTIPHHVDGHNVLYIRNLGNSQTLKTVRVHGHIDHIESGAFSSCSALETIYVGPAKYSLFQTGSFIGCSSLEDVYIHPNVYSIAFQEGAFELNAPIRIHYRDHIYYDYEDLYDELVNNPNSMSSNFTIDAQGLISRTWYISGDVKIPMIVNDQSVIGIADDCCKELPSVTSVKLFSNIVSIGSSAFYGDTSLASVVIGYGTRTIGSLAFAGCTALTSVRIKSTDIAIDDTAFDKDDVTFVYDRTSYASLTALKTAHPEIFVTDGQ